MNRLRLLVIFCLLALTMAASAANLNQKVSLDFKDADIRDVLKIVADMAGYNLFVEKSVRGNVTIRAKNICCEEFLDNLLTCNGFSWRQTDSSLIIGDERKLAETEQTVHHLSEAYPEDALKTVLQVIKKDIRGTVDDTRGLVLLSGDEETLGKARQLLQSVDRPLPTIRGTFQLLRHGKAFKTVRFTTRLGSTVTLSENSKSLAGESGKPSAVGVSNLNVEIYPARATGKHEIFTNLKYDLVVTDPETLISTQKKVSLKLRVPIGKATPIAEFEGTDSLATQLTLNLD